MVIYQAGMDMRGKAWSTPRAYQGLTPTPRAYIDGLRIYKNNNTDSSISSFAIKESGILIRQVEGGDDRRPGAMISRTSCA